jgi:oligoendopeptidase F
MQSTEQTTRWSLEDLLAEPIDQALGEAFSNLEQVIDQFEATRGSLTPEISLQEFNTVLAILESINTIKSRVEGYTDLAFAEDTQNPAVLNLRDRIDQVMTDVSNRVLFFEMWFKELPDETANKLIEQSGDLRYFLETMKRFKRFTLTEVEEKIINLKDVNGIDAMVNLYEMITNQYIFTLEVDGEEQALTRDQLGSYFQSPSPDVRAKAYQELYRVYGENSTVLAQMYIHRVRDWHTEGIELRGFSSPISARNVENDLPDDVVDTLLAVCRKNAKLFQRYFKLKARLLGINKLRRYDIYAPLTPSNKKFEYDVAKQMVLDSYKAFSPDVAELAKKVFEENHLDSEIRARKRGGAFCYAALPELTPWVMINYDGHARDIATLAHELGHAIHAMLADKHSVLTHQASLPLAETASVFAEMQLTDQLLKQESDPSVRRDLLANALDDAYITVMRQAYFTVFEKDAHEMIANNASLDELTEHYMETLKEQFSDALELSDDFKWEWISIPHLYHSPFYTYAYSFGQLLVLALYQQYRREGDAFIPNYLKILSYGGSESPMKILTEAGFDITSPDFWQGGFDVLESMIAELDELSQGDLS